jgi:hypothetical protein
MRWLILTLAPWVVGCGLFGGASFTCRAGTHPCGDGCIPTMAVCCDDGSGKTSSYCTNGATGCFPNSEARACDAVFPSGVRGQFCCGESGTIGSNDCPAGQRHCGTLCLPTSEPCCPAGASASDCPERSWDPVGCQTESGRVGCGVCLDTKSCVSCPAGSCCQGGLVCGGAGARCITGASCTGESGGAGGTGGGSGSLCSQYKNTCGTSGGIQTVGSYFPKSCACAAGMLDKGGSHLNELCGLPGQGYDCKYCECP